MLQKKSSDIMFIFEPQCHTLVTFFLNLPSEGSDKLVETRTVVKST